MNQSDRRKIDTAADDSIAKMRAARLATKEAANAITRQAPNTELQPLLDHVLATHAAALNAARTLATAVASARVESISSSLHLAVGTVEVAKSAADQLKAMPTPEQASRTREADDEAVAQLADLKAAFQNAPELGRITRLSSVSDLLTRITPQQLISIAVVVIAIYFLHQLFTGIFGPGNLVDKLAHVEYARGLITYILAAGTIAIALALVVGALLGGEENKDNFTRGKEVLTVLIGVFGTILGFYYGSAKSDHGNLEISPLAIAQSADKTQASLATTISGGEPPYTYSIKFSSDAVKDINDEKTDRGNVTQTIDTSQIPPGGKVTFTFIASDSNKNRISLASSEDQQLKGKPGGTPIPTPTTPSKAAP